MLMYCITHEAWTHPDLFDYIPSECILVMSEPPELPEDWELNLNEPSPAEMAQINLNAQELELELA